MDASATIAIIGKPNVGKSTLFNRLIGRRHAITTDIAGTTRDKVSQNFELGNYSLLLVDTGGLEYGKKKNIEADVQSQAIAALNDSDIIIFMLDLANELNVDDFAAVDVLRKSKKPVILVGNKCDNYKSEENIYNIFELGLGEAIKISAIHKEGIDKLKANILEKLKELKVKPKKKKTSKLLNISILGRPNAGKSSLVNSISGQKKSIVSQIPGTTRDTTDTEIEFEGRKIRLIDTAGLKKRGKIGKGIEKFSALRCINAINKSDIVILLIDAEIGVTAQDTHIAQYALEEQKGVILAVNKKDLLSEEEENIMISKIKRKFAFMPWVPLIFISALNKSNINELLNLALEIEKESSKRISTAELNNFLQKITYKHQPVSSKGKKPKFMYGSQVDVSPPQFVLFFKHPSNLHFSYPRYIENEIRKKYGFNGVSLDIKIKNSGSKTTKLLKKR
ncbi:ribosome biogenesis GTPase Der [Candidatus Peregrinibacteria bacterium]|nr:ribosome biogenesis GTPase Der [Candidatus Peregrinibacteria bacterium]